MQNELTHHQRAHRKNIQLWMWGEKNSDGHEYNLEISKDDKAYICPGTSTGMRRARNHTIIQPSNEEIAKKLPKYDFPFSIVNVTPATHRYMTKSHKLVNEKDEISIVGDDTIVFSRPKHLVGSKVVVWESEFMTSRHENICIFDVKKQRSGNSSIFNSFIVKLHDELFHYMDVTEKDDTDLFSNNGQCQFREYEMARLSPLIYSLQSSTDNILVKKELLSQTEVVKVETYLNIITEILKSAAQALQITLSNSRGNITWNDFEQLNFKILAFLDLLNPLMPIFKRRLLEFPDGGPGVGVSCKDVVYRVAENVRITNSDYFIRCHLSNNDSSLNDVERCQSYVGDAICDGRTINWEHKKAFEGLTSEQSEHMTHEEIEASELERMKFNAFKVAEEIALRVDGSPAPGGFMKGYTCCTTEQMFFTDSKYLSQYVNASDKQKKFAQALTIFRNWTDSWKSILKREKNTLNI